MNFTHRWFSVASMVLAVLLAASDTKAQDSEWVSLFDGKTLEGWEKVGNERACGKSTRDHCVGPDLRRCWSAPRGRIRTFAIDAR